MLSPGLRRALINLPQREKHPFLSRLISQAVLTQHGA